MTAPVTYKPDFLSIGDQAMLFHHLWNQLDWERRPGAPRREYWTNTTGQSYTYGSGVGVRTYYPRPSHPAIDDVTKLLEPVVGFTYEGCFLNGYETGKDSLGWHSDDDPGINHTRPIAVVTIGHAREIRFKPQNPGELSFPDFPMKPLGGEFSYGVCASCGCASEKSTQLSAHAPNCKFRQKTLMGLTESVILEPGSLLLMHAGMQSTHYHSIPKAVGNVGPRISLTFRSLLHVETGIQAPVQDD